jgi:hypothetical protein
MKIIRPFVASLALLSIPFCSVFAQKPQFNCVIKNNGDTIKCEFKKPLMGKLKYKPLGSDKAIKITTDEIKEYYILKDSAMFVSVLLPNEIYPEYLNLLERGNINMYEKIVVTYSRYGSTSTYYWYVNKGSDPLKEVKATTIFTAGSRKERKKMLSEMMADDPALTTQFEADDDFSIKRLQMYVHQYNQDKISNGKVIGK